MDNSVIGAGLLPGSTAGIPDLEPPIHGHQQQHHHLPHLATVPHHHHMQTMALNGDHHPMGLFDPSEPTSSRDIPVGAPRGKGVSPSSATVTNNHHHNNTSDDEDEPGFTNDDNSAEDRAKKGSPWQRMKWTDEMVRLLITVVACVGDDGAPAANDGPGKRKHSGSGGGGGGAILQKKGKWKTVSKLMLEKGCYVSPQQCEDKFNDLNKRYKRLNEILGRGTTCQVVENPALLDSMPHVSAKAKEDVRKILSSKHLFYREMCAYHNGQRIPNSHDLQGCGPPVVGSSRDDEDEEAEADDDDEDDEENGVDEERNVEFGRGSHNSLQAEMDGMLQDTTRSAWEQRDWFRKHALQLQEERMEIQVKAFELEKSRFKWQRFCSKKDRELERMRLDHERMSLENERMALQVRQREVELDFKRSRELVDSAGFGIDRQR